MSERFVAVSVKAVVDWERRLLGDAKEAFVVYDTTDHEAIAVCETAANAAFLAEHAAATSIGRRKAPHE